VFCGCVGVLPADTPQDGPRPGDRVVVIGGRTGRDGIRGATFSSMAMDATTGEVAGASVQIGDPVVEKGLIDVVIAARDGALYRAITDCGAGGLSSAVGEMAAQTGADVELAAVPRKYAGLAPWEVWLSEAQERMVLAVPPSALAALRALCARHEVELADLGSFTETGRIVVRDAGAVVADLDAAFLHRGRPRRSLAASRPSVPPPARPRRDPVDAAAALLRLLAHPSLRSNADVVRGYDHEVLGATALRPYSGAADDGPSDAAVVRPGGPPSEVGLAVGIGVNPILGALDPHRMAWAVVDEAIRNVVAVGADPARIALLDNFAWGDPSDPRTLGALAEAVRGCCAAAEAHAAPFVSGKDSLNNIYSAPDGQRRSVPPTLVITALGRLPQASAAVGSDLRHAGDAIYLVGDTRDELRGSHLDLVLGHDGPGELPAADPAAPERYRRLHRAMRAGLVAACHDLSEGGLAVAAAEMAMAGRLGLDLDLPAGHAPPVALFAESLGRLLVQIAPDDIAAFEAVLGAEATRIGAVTAEAVLRVAVAGLPQIDLPVEALLAAWQGHVPGHAAPTAPTAPTAVSPAVSPVARPTAVPAVVLAAPGTNRDGDVAHALRLAGAEPTILQLADLRADPGALRRARLVVIAGGFSFADALGSGRLFALELAAALGDELRRFVDGGHPVLGVCNGFQVLVRCGVLPGLGVDQPAALAHNRGGRFECRWVTLLPASDRCVWTAGLTEAVQCPVAHGEGRFVADEDTRSKLAANDQVALVYARGDQPANGAHPANPNGSAGDIAGICDPSGLVLGLMPHPENHVHPTQHPRWRRGQTAGSGLPLLANGVRHASEA
jgi:phosphoribosylformylglycinamidine synthase